MTNRKSFRPILLIFQVVFLAFLFSSYISGRPARPNSSVSPKDSIFGASYIKNSINYARIYDFINYNLNYIQWNNKEAIVPFYEKLKQTPNRKLKILHIGDSHVQADYFTGYVREEMQRMFGTGGRGFVFPYAAAETHSAFDYRTYCSGNWQYSRNIQPYPVYDIGISGATIHTTDSTATFSFVFKSFALKDNYKLLKLYCKQSPESYDIRLLASGEPDTILISCSQQSHLPYIPILLNSSSDTLEFFIRKTTTQQNFFECYGLLIETTEDNGVLYSSVGINGAGYKSILKETLFSSQLMDYSPDLVIIDMGANDFFGYTLNEYELEYNLKAIIDMVRKAAPSASIIISNAQDIFKRKRNIAECQPFSVLTRKVAFANNCGFFDYFNISGGKLSMLKWSKNNLAQRDRVHLSGAGYYVRGELFFNAMLNSYYQLLIKDTLEHFVLDYSKIDSLNVILTENINKNKPLYYQNDLNYKQKNPKINTKTDYYYSIKPGDNLGKIALKTGMASAEQRSLPERCC
jgi:lysophospholipase L1-like esterase